jgi:hypothetical protein
MPVKMRSICKEIREQCTSVGSKRERESARVHTPTHTHTHTHTYIYIYMYISVLTQLTFCHHYNMKDIS